jgi:hypothetical protein
MAQAGCTNLLTNGGFEEMTDWNMPLTPSPAVYSQEESYAGNWSLRTGIPITAPNRRADSLAIRTITLPAANAITLRMHVWRSSNEAESDFHYVWITTGGRTYRVLQAAASDQTWQEITFDLTSLAERQVQLLIGTFNTGLGDRALMYVDEVAITTCPLPAQTETTGVDAATATTTTTPQPTPVPTATPTSEGEEQPAGETPTAIPTPLIVPTSMIRPPDALIEQAREDRELEYGINAYLWYDAATAERNLALARQAGFSLIRQRLAWNDIEPQPGAFQWETADRIVQQANAAGLTLLVQLTPNFEDTAFWGVPVPQHRADFVRFVAAAAARYACTPAAAGCVHIYQIGEEPNRLRIWGDGEEAPEAYVELLREAYNAVKVSQPEALVISAGLAPVSEDGAGMDDILFYKRMYRALAGSSADHFDLLGVNAYALTAPPEMAASEVAESAALGQKRIYAFRHVEDVRELMTLYGDTETGIALFLGWAATAHIPEPPAPIAEPIDEFVKADYLVRALTYAANSWQPWLDLAVVLTLPDPAWFADGNPFDEERYWWAIAEPSAEGRLRLRPAYVALCHYLMPLQNETCPFPPNAPAATQDGG